MCKTAPNIKSSQSAQRLSYQLVPYILEAHVQVFTPSPFFRKIDPSPTEALAFHVTGALLSLGINYDELQETVADKIWSFVNSCKRATESILSPQAGDPENPHLDDAIRTATIAVALLGFLDAAAAQADFWKAGGRLALVQKIRKLLSEPFLVAVETALSTIRNCHSQGREVKEWKRYLRQYASSGRPLGAMLLHRSFMWLIVASTSLMVEDIRRLRDSHILDVLMARGKDLQQGSAQSHDGDFQTIESYASFAIEQMNYLEAGADYIRMGSPDQQSLAYTVKASALISFLNCSLLNEDAADIDLLMNWLQEILEDPAEMADATLASVVLRSLALICQISPSFSSTVSRILPRFMVQNAPSAETVSMGSKCLAYVLKMLSKDAVISTLYTLGNVLSPGSEQAFANGQANGVGGDDSGLTSIYAGRHSTGGSSITLGLYGEEDSAVVYGNVVQAIVGVAAACKDEKITALAQSMLLQKLEKVNTGVDARIIAGAAELALDGGQLEFRSLLKMFTRLCHLGVVDNKPFILEAVSSMLTSVQEQGY